MSDAFDRWVEWCSKPPGDRRGIPAELYAAVMSLPEADHSDRQRVNEAVRHHDEARREGRTDHGNLLPASLPGEAAVDP